VVRAVNSDCGFVSEQRLLLWFSQRVVIAVVVQSTSSDCYCVGHPFADQGVTSLYRTKLCRLPNTSSSGRELDQTSLLREQKGVTCTAAINVPHGSVLSGYGSFLFAIFLFCNF
jgi:hypothetical protein